MSHQILQRPQDRKTKFEIEKFDGINNFSMWQCEIMDDFINKIHREELGKDKSRRMWLKVEC